MPISTQLVSAESRARELPDEFIVKNKTLYCKWCHKIIHSLRKDNIVEHLHSRVHQDNRMENGLPMSFDPDSPRTQKLKEKRKKARNRHKIDPSPDYQTSELSDMVGTPPSQDEDDDIETDDEDLSQLFEDSDSEETTSFEGFEESAMFEVSPHKRGSRPRKRPARLNDSVLSPSTLSKRMKSDSSSPEKSRKSLSSHEDNLSPVSPLSIRSLPLKKQMSYSARVSNALSSAKATKKGALKIKISRKPKESPKLFHIESSETEDADQIDEQPHASHGGEGLKMKFVLNKSPKRRQSPPKRRQSPPKSRQFPSKSRQFHPRGRQFPRKRPTQRAVRRKTKANKEADLSSPDEPSSSSPAVHPDNNSAEDVVEEELVEEQVVRESVIAADGEVIEEEIVGVDEGEVVSWDDVVAEEVVDDFVQAEVEVKAATEEETLARKVNRARKMAKSVNSAQFKKKRLSSAKKLTRKRDGNEKKRKVTGYMLWSGKMRKQVAVQYPGLQFGDVSKKLGDLWKRIPDKEKQMWKYRSMKMESQLDHMEPARNKRRQGSKMIETGPKKKPAATARSPAKQQQYVPLPAFPPHRNPEQTMIRELNKLPAPTLETIDVAAYFHLLGESLTDMGKKVQNSGNGSTLGSSVIPTMLDSLMCALAPLLSLINQVPQLQGAIPDATMSDTLANVSHYIPGV